MPISEFIRGGAERERRVITRSQENVPKNCNCHEEASFQMLRVEHSILKTLGIKEWDMDISVSDDHGYKMHRGN